MAVVDTHVHLRSRPRTGLWPKGCSRPLCTDPTSNKDASFVQVSASASALGEGGAGAGGAVTCGAVTGGLWGCYWWGRYRPAMGPLCAMPPLLLLLLLELLHEAGQGPPEPPTRQDWAQPWGSLSPGGGQVWSQITIPQQLGTNTTGAAGLKQARRWGALGRLGEGRSSVAEEGWGSTGVVAAVTVSLQHPLCAPPWCSQQALDHAVSNPLFLILPYSAFLYAQGCSVLHPEDRGEAVHHPPAAAVSWP